MVPKVANPKDVAAGALYVFVGVGFALGALAYRMGTAARMGPGYLPFWLGVILTGIGVLIIMKGLRRKTSREHLEGWDLRSVFLILGSVALFGIMLEPLGLVLSILVLVGVSSLASHEFGWRTTIVNMLAIAAFSVLLFVYGLGLPFPVWPQFIRI